MHTRYGISPWIHQSSPSRVPAYSRFRGNRAADVVVVGGGVTGAAVAHACAAAGLDTVLLERNRIGQGSSGRGAGLMPSDPGQTFRDIAAAHGTRSARHVFEAWRRGSIEGAALLRRLRVRCDLEPCDGILVARPEEEKILRREYEARHDAGLDLAWLSQKQLQKRMKLDAATGIRMRDTFVLDPYRACIGLMGAAARRGAACFEHSLVRKVRFTRRHADVVVDQGTIRAGTVIVTTGSATAEFKPLQRHLKRRETYFVMTEPVPAAVRRQLGDPGTVLGDVRTPPTRVRWGPDDRLLVGGADQDETPLATRGSVLVQRTGQLMYELLTMYPAISGLQPEYGWDASHGKTADGLMYIGAHRNYPHQLFAIGGGPGGVTGAFVAARILLRALQRTPDKADEVFGWTR